MYLMSEKKSPFVNATIEEIFKIEKEKFTIQVGADFYSDDGDFVFSEAKVKRHYNLILDNILFALENGDEKQKKAAHRCLLNFHIKPLRIH